MATTTKHRPKLTREQIQALPCEYATYSQEGAPTARAAVLRFQTPGDLIAARDMSVYQYGGISESASSNSDWAICWSRFRNMLATGNGDAIHEQSANRMRDAVSRVQATASLRPTWTMAVAGYYPIVPVAIGGDPQSMRMRTVASDALAPVRVYLPMNCSARVSQGEFADSMADILGALLVLSSTRAVELIAYGSLNATHLIDKANEIHGVFMTVPIEFRSEDYKALSIWTDSSVGRSMMMGLTTALDCGYYGEWPFSSLRKDGMQAYAPATENGQKCWRHILGLDQDDVLIPPLYGREDMETIRKRLSDCLATSGVVMNWN